jgi:hypothetical protein
MIETRHDRSLAAVAKRDGKLWSSFQGIRTLPCFDLYELAGDLEALGGGEACDSFTLGVEPKARTALAGGRYAAVGNDWTVQNSLPKLLNDQTNYSGSNWLGSDGDYAMINSHQQPFGFGTYVVGEGLPFGMSGSKASDSLGYSSAASSSSDPQVAQMVQAMASFPSAGSSSVTAPISDTEGQLTPPPLVGGQYGHG